MAWSKAQEHWNSGGGSMRMKIGFRLGTQSSKRVPPTTDRRTDGWAGVQTDVHVYCRHSRWIECQQTHRQSTDIMDGQFERHRPT